MPNTDLEKLYKITEIFTSLQGEGRWAGTPMTFVRLAQCPVGGVKGICHAADGYKFICDTGATYKPPNNKVEFHAYTEVNQTLTVDELLAKVEKTAHSRILCLTGGEPFIYPLAPIVRSAVSQGIEVHFETSGTIPLDSRHLGIHKDQRTWVTWSPKLNCRDEYFSLASEVKLLVHADTELKYVESWMAKCRSQYTELRVQPIDGKTPQETYENLQWAQSLCLNLGCSLSIQTHKHLAIR